MIKLKTLFRTAVVCQLMITISPYLAGQEIVPPIVPEEELKNESNKEVAARERDEQDADRLVVKARKAFQEDRYAESVDMYNQAIAKLEKISEKSAYIREKVKNIRQNTAVVYYYWAREIAAQAVKDAEEKKFAEAIAKCDEAKKIDPSLTEQMERLKARFKQEKSAAQYTNDTSVEVVDPNKKERLYQIDILMAQGRKLYDQDLYHRAREKFEEVLVLNPYYVPAITMIKKLTKKMFKAGKKRYEVTKIERDAEVLWKNVTPLLPHSLSQKTLAPAPIERKVAGSKIKKKLEDIMIEHMEFEDASIQAVVNMLRIEAKKQDKDKEGVNILLRLAAGSKAADSSAGSDDGLGGDDTLDGGTDDFLSDDPLGDDGGGAGGDILASDSAVSASTGGGPTITIMFDDLSLGEAIRNICLAAGLKYRVEEFAVVIAGKDVPLDDLETRIYPIDSDVSMGDETSDGGGEGTTAASVQSFFQRQGILFPEGAKAVYDSSISRLIVTNTPEQLRRIERIIDELNVVDPQVLIECKFVEIKEDKQNEFGIAWNYGKPVGTANRSVTFNPNDQPLRFLGANSELNDDVAFGLSHTDKDSGITVSGVVHALDLDQDTDILSCPRITTQNGEEATIRMVTEVFFPDSWGEPTLIDNGATDPKESEVGYVSSMPEFGEATELGVKLTVTPTVDPDKYTITLDMIPVVQAQVDWTDYSYIQATSGGTVKNTVRMVIIEARTVTTQVTIYDGETVVMGGIMRDSILTMEDKWPIIGDLPLVGRFFRSRAKTAIKENLLIFTTPRLVNPNGSPLRQREVRGKPPFRM